MLSRTFKKTKFARGDVGVKRKEKFFGEKNMVTKFVWGGGVGDFHFSSLWAVRSKFKSLVR